MIGDGFEEERRRPKDIEVPLMFVNGDSSIFSWCLELVIALEAGADGVDSALVMV